MKNRKQHDLEELLKNNLSDKTAIVPDLVWDKIEEELFPKKKRRGFFWFFFFGVLVMAGIAGAYFFSGKNTRKTQDSHIAISEYDDIPKFKTGAKSGGNAKQETGSKGNGKDVSKNESTGSNQKEAQRNLKPAVSHSSKNLSVGIQKDLKKDRDFHRHKKSTTDSNPMQPGKNEPQISKTSGELTTPETADHAAQLGQKDSIQLIRLPFMKMVIQTETIPSRIAEPFKNQVNELRDKKFSIAMYGGTSMYEMAVFKEYFTSGQLSKRTFESNGFEVGAGFNYKLRNKFGIYSNIAFNRKNTSFNYSLAITESDYFNRVLNGELLPLETIIDNGIGNCFLVENVAAQYRVDSWLISLGTTYELLKWKRLNVGVDLRFSANLNSSMHLEKLTVIQVQNYSNEKFNYLKIGGGLVIDYRFVDRFSVGIAPICHFQLNPDKQSFYKGNVKELVVPVVFKVYF